MTRQQAEGNRQLSSEELEQIFQAKAGDVFAARGAVVKITAVQPPTALVAGQAVTPMQNQMARSLFDELSQESGVYAQAKLKTRTNLQLARQAIGVSPQAPTPLGSALPAPKPGAPGQVPAPAKRAQ
jgi:hypothetical protein